MAVASIPVLSREYLWVPVTALGEEAADLTTLPVEMAFLTTKPPADPDEVDWEAGDWSTTVPDNATAIARCLMGPGGGVELTVGTYYVWIRITGATERPVRYSGQLKIT